MTDITIPPQVFQDILSTLETTLYLSRNTDLADAYRHLKDDVAWSPLTRRLDQMVGLVQEFTPQEKSVTEKDDDVSLK